MKRNYYCLVAGLQDITLDVHKLSMGQMAFKAELQTEVHPDDYQLAQKLFLPTDNLNLLNLLEKNDKPFDPKGNYSREQLEENIKEPTDLPAYMQTFILAYKAKEPVYPHMSPENELTNLFFDFMQSEPNDFLRNWFTFNKNLNNLLTALLARKHEVKYENQIVGHDDISDAIRKSHARDFGISAEIDFMEELLNIARTEQVQDREKAIDQLKWKYLDEETFFEYFTMEKLLAFTLKLGMVERWLAIDKDHGSKMFRQLLDELQASYELPETFTEK